MKWTICLRKSYTFFYTFAPIITNQYIYNEKSINYRNRDIDWLQC